MKQRQRPKIPNELDYRRLSGKESDSENEIELFSKKSKHQEVSTVEIAIEDGDTLQALSIRYHCSIAELKRLNNIHKENEIFAKRTIKVPEKPFSMALAGVHTSGTSSPKDKIIKQIDAEAIKSKLSDKLINLSASSSSEAEVNEVIFNSSIKSATSQTEAVEEHLISDLISDEEINLIPKRVTLSEVVVTKLSCSGADADISWIALIICIVIVIFAVPLIYVFYVAEHIEQYHHPL